MCKHFSLQDFSYEAQLLLALHRRTGTLKSSPYRTVYHSRCPVPSRLVTCKPFHRNIKPTMHAAPPAASAPCRTREVPPTNPPRLFFPYHIHLSDPGNVPEGCNKTYTVRSGDRCDTIAPNYGLEVAQLQTLNPGVDCEKLVIDQRLCVQPRDPLPPPPPAPPPNVPLPAPSPTPNTPPPAPSPTPNNPQLVIAQQQGRGGGGSGGGLSALEIMGTVISIVVGLLSLAAVVVVVIRRCPFWKNRPKKMTKLELKLVTMGSA